MTSDLKIAFNVLGTQNSILCLDISQGKLLVNEQFDMKILQFFP